VQKQIGKQRQSPLGSAKFVSLRTQDEVRFAE
jgi:hypothetical protein